MTYVEVFSISEAAFFRVTNAFDDAKRLVRKHAAQNIVRRGIINLVRELRRQHDPGDGRSFMDLILDAARNGGDGVRASVASAAGGTGDQHYRQLSDELASTRASVETLQADMGSMRAGLNRLLAKAGLEPCAPLRPPGAGVALTGLASPAPAAGSVVLPPLPMLPPPRSPRNT